VREVRFRAWEKTLKQIIPVNNIDFESKQININSAWRCFKEIELMQYTGLKDKNSKEIYEGDILSRKDWGMGGGHDPEERYEVGLINDYIYEEEQSWHFKVHLWGEWCEVIGNIYENPKLLESEAK
jgi:uncharacterized phage protein (TIGR01671 family)